MMRPRWTPIALLLALLLPLVAGCGGDDDGGSSSTSTSGSEQADITIQPYSMAEPGAFVEGAVSAYAIDPKDGELAATAYDSPTKLQVAPGRHVVFVQVLPCTARCTSWKDVLASIDFERSQNDGTSTIEDQLITCEGSFDADVDGRLTLTPIIDGKDCSIEEGAAAESSGDDAADCDADEGTPTAASTKAATRDDLIGNTFRFATVDGCPVPDDLNRTISFTENSWSGMLACNSVNGTWTLKEGALALGDIASTLMACEDEPSDIDPADLQHVEVTEDGALVFSNDDGDTIAVTAAPEPTA